MNAELHTEIDYCFFLICGFLVYLGYVNLLIPRGSTGSLEECSSASVVCGLADRYGGPRLETYFVVTVSVPTES